MTKKALVILTNESFLPQSGRGSPSYSQPIKSEQTDEDVTRFAPSTWQSPMTTTHAPTKVPSETDEFNTLHRPTGVDILEVGHLWFKLAKQENWELTFATPRGGAVAIDPLSIKALDKKFADEIWHDSCLMAKLNHTYPVAWVDPKEYQCVVIPGSHAAMLDLPECHTVSKTIARVWQEAGCIAAIGHGVAALLNVREDESRSRCCSTDYLVSGKRLTCYTQEEEEKAKLSRFVPYSIEELARKRGAKLEKGRPFESKVVVDESEHGKCLITAQSYPSIHDFIQALIKHARR